MPTLLNVLIVEDHPLIVEAYKTTFNQYCKQKADYHTNFHLWNDLETASQEINKISLSDIDLVILDMQLPLHKKSKFLSGKEVGIALRKKDANTKIIVITSLYDSYQIYSILKSINPEGLLIKNEIGANELNLALENILAGEAYYSQRVYSLIRNKNNHEIYLEPTDHKLLFELSQGSKTNELPHILHLSKTSVERRKRKIKEIFGVVGENDRKLLDAAREKGFI
jgi:DNA-binding NarL/FixJ family response regulator